MIQHVKKLKSLLTAKEKKQAVVVLCLTILSAFTEMIGIASILPFIAVLSSPDIVQTNQYLKYFYDFFGFTSANNYMFFLGLVVLFMLIISNAIKAFASWKTLSFSVMAGHSVSTRLFRQFLMQPYAFFLKRNSADLAKTILSEIQGLVARVILPTATIFARLLVVIAILILLMITDPTLALSSGIILGSAFGITYMSMRKWLLQIGNKRLYAQGQKFKTVNEAFSGIKNIKLTGHEMTYGQLYESASEDVSKTSALASVAEEMPRYALEVIAFGGILFILLYLLMQDQNLSQALPLMTLYAFAGYRLMPSFQAVFQSYTKIRFHVSVLDEIFQEMQDTSLSQNALSNTDQHLPPLPFQDTISFENVTFTYDQQNKPTLKNLTFEIRKNTSIGIVGRTGTGKTTVIDLLLGLLSPNQGQIKIDDTILNDETIRAWQKNCAYVSQSIYLTDDTIRANIAFGQHPDEIDDERVKHVARIAALDHFIEHELQNGYHTVIGENGVRLSGGQKQRIGLARALYLDRPVLVLDEATSALDSATEDHVINAIKNMQKDKTIIMVAHRTHTLQHADTIFNLEDMSFSSWTDFHTKSMQKIGSEI